MDDVWSSVDGSQWEPVLEHAPWGPRTGLAAASFEGRMWVSGGSNCDQAYAGDLWSSTDGLTWIQMPEPPWYGRDGHALIAFDGKLWVLGGGFDGWEPYGDVWYTADGSQWTQVAQIAPWGKRLEFGVTVHAGALWLFGGRGLNGTELNDIWTSADGIRWTPVTQSAAWSPRVGPAAVSHAEKLWIIGGSEDRISSHFNDVWSSTNGISWALSAEDAPWPANFRMTAIPVNDRIVLLGGSDNRVSGSVVRASVDGSTWTDALGQRWAARTWHTAASHGGFVWVMGGRSRTSDGRDVWRSRDGRDWELVTAQAPWQRLFNAAAVSFRNRLWVVGGSDLKSNEAQLWWTEDGVSWTRPATPPWQGRWNHSVTIFKDKLWVIGGERTGGDVVGGFDDAWFSADGENWTEALGGPTVDSKALRQIGARHRHATVEFDGRLWLIGGLDRDYRNSSEVWWTENGVDWTKVGNPSPFAGLNSHRVLAHDDKMWLLGGSGFGGSDGSVTPNERVWTTTDGIDWKGSTTAVPWTPRQHIGATVHEGRILVLGGESSTSTHFNDVWSTSGGGGFESIRVASPAEPETVIGSVVESPHPDVVRFGFGDEWVMVLKGDRVPPAIGAKPVVFQGRLGLLSDVHIWWTDDGATWERTPIRTPQGQDREPQRSFDNIVAHDGALWAVTSGWSGTGTVWRSENGVDFEAATLRSPWETYDQWFVSFRNRLWLIGGLKANRMSNQPSEVGEVWSSADGAVWELESAAPPWNGRVGYERFEFADKLWIVGGYDANWRRHEDAWTSSDGREWVQHSRERWPKSETYDIFSAGDWIWFVDHSRGDLSVVWRTRNGEEWEEFAPSLDIPKDVAYAGIEFDGRLWMLAGPQFRDQRTDERGPQLWSVSDAGDWRHYRFSDFWKGSFETETLAHDERLWIFAPESGEENRFASQVWVSSDGAGWDLVTDTPEWQERSRMGLVSHAGRMWLLGGNGDNRGGDEYKSDVWVSADGATWERVTESAPWSPREDVRCVSFNGQILLFGGRGKYVDETTPPFFNDVWSAADGVVWERISEMAPVAGLEGSSGPVVFDGRLWILDGAIPRPNGRGVDRDSVGIYVSEDAVRWERVDVGSTWVARTRVGAVVHDDRLWAIGGSINSSGSDVLSSEPIPVVQWSVDGRHWTTKSTGDGTGDSWLNAYLSAGGRLWIVNTIGRQLGYLRDER